MDDRAREVALTWYDDNFAFEEELAAAISAYGDEREREALERAAHIAMDADLPCADDQGTCHGAIAIAIRSLIKTAPEGETK